MSELYYKKYLKYKSKYLNLLAVSGGDNKLDQPFELGKLCVMPPTNPSNVNDEILKDYSALSPFSITLTKEGMENMIKTINNYLGTNPTDIDGKIKKGLDDFILRLNNIRISIEKNKKDDLSGLLCQDNMCEIPSQLWNNEVIPGLCKIGLIENYTLYNNNESKTIQCKVIPAENKKGIIALLIDKCKKK
jgi:hypothetical protein